jgi:hypothetical protein
MGEGELMVLDAHRGVLFATTLEEIAAFLEVRKEAWKLVH